MNEGRLRVKARRFLTLFLCVLLTFGPICRVSFADDYESGGGGSHDFGGSYPSWGTVWYGPSKTSNTVGTTYYQYGVVANTKYDAALYNLDINESLYGEITNKVKAVLLTDGNAFKEFADIFKVGKPDLDPSLIFNTDYAVISSWKSACDLYGETYCFSAMYTLAQKQAARDYVISVLQQGGSGGGSGGGGLQSDGIIEIEGYKLIPLEVFKPEPTMQVNYIALDDVRYDNLIALQPDTSRWCATVANDCKRFRVWAATSDSMEFEFYETHNSASYALVFDGDSANTKYYNANYSAGNLRTLVDGEGEGAATYENCYVITGSINNNNWGTGKKVIEQGCNYRWNGADVVQEPEEDPDPPVTWPDPPTGPTVDPPTVPTPPEPDPPTPPDPTPPDPPTPWVPIPGPDDDPITGDEFQDLIDALAEHCKHIRDNVTDNVGQLWTNQSELLVTEFSSTRDTLTDNLQWLGTDVIAKGFTDLSSYLNELFQWLADQMEFNVNVESNPYDDTSVIYWLKRIWSKLGSGDITTRPTDPNVDNDGWWEWLTGLLGGLVGALADIGLDKLGGLVDALDTLKDKFPFCVPWDVAALLALLVSEPVAPVVSVPMFALTATDGVQQVGSMTIDLDTYSTAWEAVRWIERIGFCVYLAMRSKDFLDLLGKIKG